MTIENLFDNIKSDASEEIIAVLLKTSDLKLERILSTGQATPQGEWYDQDQDEWVILLQGSAGLLFENETEICTMTPGDYVFIPAHFKHRVEWTDPHQPTIWLALHGNLQDDVTN